MKLFIRIMRFIEFIPFYLWKVLQSNIYVAAIILTPKLNVTPAIVEVPVHLRKRSSILLFFNLVTMTPGTLSMDLNNNGKSIYIHAMNLKSEEKFVHALEQLELKIQKILE
jgi:multicomponent Na+:H+ antiporter subunit E